MHHVEVSEVQDECVKVTVMIRVEAVGPPENRDEPLRLLPNAVVYLRYLQLSPIVYPRAVGKGAEQVSRRNHTHPEIRSLARS